MLIGAYCARDRNITANAFDEARRRLHNFGFIGLTDNYNASVCLLSRMYGITPQRFMFGAHARPGSSHANKPLIGGGERVSRDYWKQIQPGDDPLDWQVWTLAKEIFHANLQRYGFWEMDYRKLEHGIQA